ncbi:MAG: hypothetical protein KJO31_17210, partial [Gammaproteobacteria bacterium]|nr:hypothetical protein [Gammaproteobacteria bacterium]
PMVKGAAWGIDASLRTLCERWQVTNYTQSHNVRLRESVMRSKAYSTFVIPLLATICVIAFIDTAAADNDRHHDDKYRGNKYGVIAKAEIEELMSCYAYSFDAIARAVTATYSDPGNLEYLDPMNLNDPNFAEGYERFRSCTTKDFVIEIYELDGTPVLREGDIPAGPLPWVNIVNFFNRIAANPVTNSQHLFGSFSAEVKGRKGTLTAYAAITGYSAAGKGEGGTSTYTSEVVYKRGKWLLKKTTLVEN